MEAKLSQQQARERLKQEIEQKTKYVRDSVNEERLALERRLREQKEREEQKVVMKHRLVKEQEELAKQRK